MKTIAVVLVVCIVVAHSAPSSTPKRLARYLKRRAGCVETTHANEDLVDKAIKGEIADNEELNTYLVCLAKKYHFEDDDGHFLKDNIKQSIAAIYGDETATKVSEKCTEETFGSASANTVHFAKCLFKYAAPPKIDA